MIGRHEAWSCLGLAGHELKFASPPEDAAAVRAVGTRPLPKDRVLLRKKQKKDTPRLHPIKEKRGRENHRDLDHFMSFHVTSCDFHTVSYSFISFHITS